MAENRKKPIARSVTEYMEVIQKPVRLRTVTLLIRGNRVLLGLKMRGFGKGNYLGVGGKVEDEKDRSREDQDLISVVKAGAKREIQEEIGIIVDPHDLKPMGVLNFYFPHIEDESWNQQVHVFIAINWQGEPKAELDNNGKVEIQPEWFEFNEVPLDKMWDDARYWLPSILEGKQINGDFVFDEELKVIDRVFR